MLILTRRVGETVKIGDEIEVTVLSVKGTQVRIGVNAPKSVRVDREEIRNRIEAEGMRDGAVPRPLVDARGVVSNPALRTDR